MQRDGCHVAQGAVLGSNTVIGNNCIIDRDVLITNSLILPGAYVGEGLELNDCIVGRSKFVNVRLEATVEVADPLLISSVST